jgi:hypothetical protein
MEDISVMHRFFHLVLPLAATLALPGAAQAGNRPAQACRPIADIPGSHGLWLGHFTGGRRIAGYQNVEWRDDYACFTSGAECARWWRGLRSVYRDVEGHGTCLPLRAGGVPTFVVKPVAIKSVVKARY